MAKVPLRLSEGYFRLFEPTIGKAVSVYPEAVSIGSVGDWTINTTLGRLRDAVLSYRRFHWDSAIIDADLFVENWPRIQIRLDDKGHSILLGPRVRYAGRPPKHSQPKPEQITTVASREEDVLSVNEVQAFLLLLSTGRIRGPVQIVGHDIASLEALAVGQDITVFEDTKKIYII